MKGGYSAVHHSYARANHKDLGSEFRPSQPQSTIIALDATNQYGDGEYFCVVCNTQSQQLGTETIMDDDTVPGGFGLCDRTNTSKSSKGKTKYEILRRKQLCDVGLR